MTPLDLTFFLRFPDAPRVLFAAPARSLDRSLTHPRLEPVIAADQRATQRAPGLRHLSPDPRRPAQGPVSLGWPGGTIVDGSGGGGGSRGRGSDGRWSPLHRDREEASDAARGLR